MKKLLYVVGPTATGKTNISLDLASRLNGDLVSADSRQIYRGMDIGTGKDIPKGFKSKTQTINDQQITCYKKGDISIWGYDLVNPNQEYSIAHFQKFTSNIIKNIHNQGRLPIIVGGTGFYLQSIENPPKTISIPQNQELRKSLSAHSLLQLQRKLKKVNIGKFNKMNKSDVNNKRRLVRALEVEDFISKNKKVSTPAINQKFNSLWIGLKAPLSIIDQKIDNRVEDRINKDFEKEFFHLTNKGFLNESSQASTSMGYKQWIDYKNNKTTRKEAIKNWKTSEKQYARRQLTWFNKQKNINWHSIDSINYKKSVVELVRVWYS